MVTFPPQWSDLDTVLCHDWLTGMRGGERVLEVLCQGFAKAPILTLVHNRQAVSSLINSHPITPSVLQRIPGITRHYRWFLPLFPKAIEHMHVPRSDLVISTSHCVAKGVRPPAGARHLSYCFTPMRYAWTFQREYFGDSLFKGLLASSLMSSLRSWDRAASTRVDRFVAISRHVRDRIQRFYGREADVVYPPVDTALWTPSERPVESPVYDLIVSALVPYKRIDLAVRTYTQLGFPLKVVGIGTGLRRLRALAGGNVDFLGWQTDEAILSLYRNCRMLVFPGEEDFGIVPLEAQACGRPVVAYGRGGALETVRENVSGVFFPEQTEESLARAVADCASREWDSQAIRTHAEQFGKQEFIDALAQSIDACLTMPRQSGGWIPAAGISCPAPCASH